MRTKRCVRFSASGSRLLLFGLLFFCLFGGFVPTSSASNETIGCSPGPSTQMISYGTVAACGIEYPYLDESDLFPFSGTYGESIYILLTRTAGTGTACFEINNVYGYPVAGPNCTTTSTEINWSIPANGTYTIDVYEQFQGNPFDYNLTLERIAPPSPSAIDMTFGQARGGNIDPFGEVDLYTTSGAPGETVTVTVYRLGDSGVPCLEPRTPFGTAAAATECGLTMAQSSFTLTSGSPYVFLVYSQFHSSTLQYSIQVECTSGCPVQPPPDLTKCLNPRSLNATVPLNGPSIERFFTVGSAEIANCSLPAVADFSTSVTLLNGGGWATVSPSSGTFIPGAANTITVTLDPAALGATAAAAANQPALSGAGTYQGVIEVTIPSLNQTLKLPVNLTAVSGPQLALNWRSFAFQTVEQTAAPPPQKLRIFNAVAGNLDWSISPAEESDSFPSWLNVAPLSGTAGNTGAQASTVTISVDPTGLTAGTTNIPYTALLKVTSPNASNSPQYISVTFHVVRITAAPVPWCTAYGMIFRSPEGGPAPPAQSFELTNTGGGFVTAALSITTQSGGNWLLLSKTSSTANTDTNTGPDTITVRVNPVGLPAGFYRGKIRAVFTAERTSGSGTVSRPDQEVEVVLIVEPAGGVALQRSGEQAAACQPITMELVGATVGNGLNIPVSFPQVLMAQLLDNCGQGVTGATAVAVADGQTVSLAEVGGGLYSGNWTPQKTNDAATVAFSIFHPTLGSLQRSYTVSAVTASGGTVLPNLFDQGVVEGAGFSSGRPLVPGGIISLFGSNLAPEIGVAGNIPLERKLAGTSVRIGNVDAPLYFVSPGQINAQLPFESQPGDTVSIVVNSNGRLTSPQLYQISPAQPGIFKTATDAAVLDENFQLVTAENPAHIGRVIQIFAAGLGFTDPPVDTGAGGPSFSNVQIPVTVTIGGIEAHVEYQGLAPNYVGLYQVNAVVPQGVTPGDAVPIVITQDGIPSNPDFPATLPVAE